MKTQMSQMLEMPGYKMRYDDACQQFLQNRRITAWILKETVQEYRDCSLQQIEEKILEGNTESDKEPCPSGKNPEPSGKNSGSSGKNNRNSPRRKKLPEKVMGSRNVDSVPGAGKVVFDFQYRLPVIGRKRMRRLYVNLEAQGKFRPGYSITKRGIYYDSRMLASQYGLEFSGRNYNGLQKCYSIFICLDVPKHLQNTMAEFCMEQHIRKDKNRTQRKRRATLEKWEYDLITVIQIRLGDYEEAEGIIRMLDIAFSTALDPTQKKKLLEEEYELVMDDGEMEVLESMCTFSDGVEAIAERKGRKEGRKEERELYLQKQAGHIRSLMKKTNWSAREAMDACSISSTEQKKIMAIL